MITADILPPCDGQTAGQLSEPATGRSTRRHTSASRGLLAALPVLVGAHSAFAAPESATPAPAATESGADATAAPNGSVLTESTLSPLTRATRRTGELPESGVRRRSTRATMPVVLERALGINAAVEAGLPLTESSPSSLDPFALVSHHSAVLQDGVVRRRSTRATMPQALARTVNSTPSTVEFKRAAPVVRTVAFAKATPLMAVPAMALPPMPVNTGKAILPRSSFADSRLETTALRVMRPQSTEWLQFTGARSLESAHAAAPFAAPIPARELSADATRGMRKVISVSALKVPPTNKPLPAWMQARAISADKAGAVVGTARTAQNPNAAPLRQPARPVTNSDRLPNQLEVSAGTFVVLLTTTDLNTVAIADPTVADVAVVNSRSVLVNGKAPGVTSLVIVDQNRIRQYQVRVSPAQGTRATDVASAIGLSGVSVRPLRDALVLEGEVDSPEEARRAVEIAGVFSPKVLNQLTVRGAPSSDAALAAQIQSAINLPNVSVRTIGETVVIDGTVENAAQRQRAQNVAEALGKKVLNLIELPVLTIDQVRESIGALPAESTATDAVGIRVRQVGDQIILEGFAPNQNAIDQAITTSTRTGFQVVNRIQVAPAVPTEVALLNSINAAINMPGVRAAGNSSLVILQGTVADTNASMAAEQIARAFAREVQNHLQTSRPLQVDIDVSIVEINRNDSKNLGLQYGSVQLLSETVTAPTATTPGSVARTIDPTFRQGVGLAGNGFIGTGGLGSLDPFRVRLDALYANGGARLLSNPRTTVLSGRLASFQVGGQVPIPVGSTTNGSGTSSTISFKDFGVLVDVMPTASTSGVVTMRIHTEVSQPDFTVGVTPPGGGSPIPGFSRRSTTSEVSVPPNGTIALSGLIQNNVTKNISKVPFLSQIPILGSLFQSRRFQDNKTELVIFVRPRVLSDTLANGALAPASVVGTLENGGTPFNVGGDQTGKAVTDPTTIIPVLTGAGASGGTGQ